MVPATQKRELRVRFSHADLPRLFWGMQALQRIVAELHARDGEHHHERERDGADGDLR